MKRNYYKEITNTDLTLNHGEQQWNEVFELFVEEGGSYRVDAYGVNYVAYEIWNCDCFAGSTTEEVVANYIDCIINYDM